MIQVKQDAQEVINRQRHSSSLTQYFITFHIKTINFDSKGINKHWLITVKNINKIQQIILIMNS